MLKIDPSLGTHVIGSNFGKLLTTYRDDDQYPHEVQGRLHFSDDGWLRVNIHGEVQDYYAWYVRKLFGVKLHVRSLWGAHVSVVRGEKIRLNANKWGAQHGKPFIIKHTHDIFTNGEHWWLNIEGEELSKLRNFYGLKSDSKWFHLTIGRL